jgi:hypothetical protein
MANRIKRTAKALQAGDISQDVAAWQNPIEVAGYL